MLALVLLVGLNLEVSVASPLSTPTILPFPVSLKFIVLLAFGSIFPLASVTSTDIYDKSYPSASIVFSSAVALSLDASPEVVTLFLPCVPITSCPLESYALALKVPSLYGTVQVK